MKIFALTLNWNGLDMLKKLKPGLEANLSKFDWNWWIRDNGSKDGSPDEISKWSKGSSKIHLLKKDHNRDNFSVGVNSLFDESGVSDDDLVLLLNNDISFCDDASISNMIDLMSKTNSAICGARILFPDTNLISHCGVAFSRNHGNMPWHIKSHESTGSFDRKNRYFQAVTAACCLVKASSYKKAGKLNKNLHWSFEDIDLNLEISINQKEKVVCCGSTNIEHKTSASLNKNPVNKMFLSHNVRFFQEKWLGKYVIDYHKYLENPCYNEVKS
jgi:GT2 family glycosyltransferase